MPAANADAQSRGVLPIHEFANGAREPFSELDVVDGLSTRNPYKDGMPVIGEVRARGRNGRIAILSQGKAGEEELAESERILDESLCERGSARSGRSEQGCVLLQLLLNLFGPEPAHKIVEHAVIEPQRARRKHGFADVGLERGIGTVSCPRDTGLDSTGLAGRGYQPSRELKQRLLGLRGR